MLVANTSVLVANIIGVFILFKESAPIMLTEPSSLVIGNLELDV